MLGEPSLFTLSALNLGGVKHRSLRIRPFREVDALPNFLFALSHAASPGLTHEGLEFLSMMLIRLPENATLILRQRNWSSSLVPLLLNAGVQETTEVRPKSLAAKVLNEILGKESGIQPSSSPGPLTSPPALRRASACGSSHQSPQPLSTEALLAINLKLSLNLWVLLHYTCFTSCTSTSGDDSFFSTLIRSIDAIEDAAGWVPHVLLLVRVLLVALCTKIHSSAALKRTMRMDVSHVSWNNLVDLLAVVENFVFYSPLVSSGTKAGEQQSARRSQQAAELFGKLKRNEGPGGRRTASAMVPSLSSYSIHPLPGATMIDGSFLARPQDCRRFKLVGIHMSLPGSNGGAIGLNGGECDDVVLVSKVLELLEGLKVQELDCSLDGSTELVDRERMKKIKKRGLEDLEFFRSTREYLQSCSQSQSLFKSASNDALPVPTRSVPELLERRRHARNTSRGGIGGFSLFHNLTRNRRLRSMEAKLNASSHAVVLSPKPELTMASHIDPASTLSPPGPGRNFRFAQRNAAGRIEFHSTIHTKINVELALMKIEAHYAPHRARRSSSNAVLQPPATAQSGIQQPPPIPNRPAPAVLRQLITPKSPPPHSSPSNISSTSSSQPPPLPPYSPRWAHAALPLSPLAAGTPRRVKTGRLSARPGGGVRVPPSLSHLMKRPLPELPSDKQTTAPIVVSPKHSGPELLEPKEMESERREMEEEQGIVEMSEAAGEQCCLCQQTIVADEELWHGDKAYCRACFLHAFCSCAVCTRSIDAGQSFVLSRLDSDADLTVRVAAPEDEMISLRSEEDDQGRLDSVLYHPSCLSCCAAEHVEQGSKEARSDSTNSMDEQLAALEGQRWFQVAGRIYCLKDYIRLHGTACAQCRQIITTGCVRALGQSWHADCFSCAGDCGRALSADKFYLAPAQFISPPLSPAAPHATLSPRGVGVKANKSAYCESCFTQQFNFCHFCSEPLAADEKGVLVKQNAGPKRPYHARCYQCVICLKVNAPDEKLYAGEDDGSKLYCYQHFVWKFFAHCPTCDQPVGADEERSASVSMDASATTICINDVEYHLHCALCAVCKVDLNQPGQQVFTKETLAARSSTAMSPGASPTPAQILLCSQHQDYEPAPTPSPTPSPK
jgi:hypothetical protein